MKKLLINRFKPGHLKDNNVTLVTTPERMVQIRKSQRRTESLKHLPTPTLNWKTK